MPARTVLTIGNFDGVHQGHATLVRRARAIADAHPAHGPGGAGAVGGTGGRPRVIALAFFPHPAVRLAPGRVPATLSTFEHREAWLRALGADEVQAIAPTPEMLSRTPQDFVRWLVERHNPLAIVEGTDFHFGKGRAGSVRTLADLGRESGFSVEVVQPVEVALTDQTIVTASSTITRWLIDHGRVRDAANVLGRPYTLTGTVIRGDRRGRTLGFPTANLDTTQAIPGDGVYGATAILPDGWGGRRFAAAVHVGPRATFDSTARTVEAFLLDWDGPLAQGAQEYGWSLTLEFRAWLRGQAKFDSAEALVAQIQRDVQRVRSLGVGTGAPPLQEALA